MSDKIGELTPQETREADLALMCSLNLTQYSIVSIKDFNITRVITERTKDNETTYCLVETSVVNGDKEIKSTGSINLKDLSKFDSSITKELDIDEIKNKLNNCAGMNFIANHIQS